MKEATTLKQRFDFFKTTIGERNAKIGYYVKVFEISLRMVVDRKLQKNILVHKKIKMELLSLSFIIFNGQIAPVGGWFSL